MPNLSEIISPLLSWYRESARELPFRSDPTPYHVWLSEIMLQQTRVEAVLPYYHRFLSQLPDLESLANAPEDKLLKLWEGLGYYNRVRNLQKAARVILEQHDGVFPSDPDTLRKLPGIGDYTAGAIASIAFGIPAPAIDGNVLRVISRVLASRENIDLPGEKKRIRSFVEQIIPGESPGDFNQALMELGATVCLPGGAPRCEVCPLSGLCEARALGRAEELPVRNKKRRRTTEDHTLFLLFTACDPPLLALRRRSQGGLLSGMWELPGTQGALSLSKAKTLLEERGFVIQSLDKLPKAKHIFTHLEWHLTGYRAIVQPQTRAGSEYTWVTKEQLQEEYSLPSAFRQWDLK